MVLVFEVLFDVEMDHKDASVEVEKLEAEDHGLKTQISSFEKEIAGLETQVNILQDVLKDAKKILRYCWWYLRLAS